MKPSGWQRHVRVKAKAVCIGVSALAFVAASCGEDDENASLPPAPTVLDITMREYRYEHRRVVPAGRVVLRARNLGRKQHEIVLLSLPENFPPIDKQLHSRTRRPLGTLGYLRRLKPGESDAFAADLKPGRYAMIDSTSDRPRGETYALQGMNSEFRVR